MFSGEVSESFYLLVHPENILSRAGFHFDVFPSLPATLRSLLPDILFPPSVTASAFFAGMNILAEVFAGTSTLRTN
jgi:hypothetical protein